MTTFYAAVGDIDGDSDADADDRAAEHLTAALDEHDIDIESVDIYTATDRCMALIEFHVDSDVTADELAADAGDAIGVADDPDPADEVLEAMKPYHRECFASLSVRGLSPRAASCRRDE